MPEPKYPSRLLDRLMLRMPDGMRERLAAAAKANKRSVNAEVLARLERTFVEEDDPDRSNDIAEFARRLIGWMGNRGYRISGGPPVDLMEYEIEAGKRKKPDPVGDESKSGD